MANIQIGGLYMKLILENRLIHGIPLLECYTLPTDLTTEHIYKKPLLFFNHGLGSCKEENYSLIIELANHGFYVIAMDAYLHGERLEEPLISGSQESITKEVFNIVRRTSRDITYLFKHHYMEHFTSFSVMGISLGGMVAFYTATISENVKGIIPIIGTPSFVKLAKHEAKRNGFTFNDDAYLDELHVDDPMNHLDHFEKVKLLMIIGTEDEVVPDKWTKQFYELLVNRGINSEAKLLEYEVGHLVTDKMIKDLLAWCVDNLL
jgi:hypothetical protein